MRHNFIDNFDNFDNQYRGGDVLDLRQISALRSLDEAANYLHFSSSGLDTLIEISATGGFVGGYRALAVDDVVRINGLDLTCGARTNAEVIALLHRRGKILINSTHHDQCKPASTPPVR